MDILNAKATAKPGEQVPIESRTGESITAKAGNEINSGKVLVVPDDTGGLTAFSPSSPIEKIRSQKIRRRKPSLVRQTIYPLKILFSVEDGDYYKFFVGGDRATPQLIHQIPIAAEIEDAILANTGKKANDWTATFLYSQSGEYYCVTVTQDGATTFSGDRFQYYEPKGNGVAAINLRRVYEIEPSFTSSIWNPRQASILSSSNRTLLLNYYLSNYSQPASVTHYIYLTPDLAGSSPNPNNLIPAIDKPANAGAIALDTPTFRTLFDSFTASTYFQACQTGNLTAFGGTLIPYTFVGNSIFGLPSYRAPFFGVFESSFCPQGLGNSVQFGDRNLVRVRLTQMSASSPFGDFDDFDESVLESIYVKEPTGFASTGPAAEFSLTGQVSDRSFNQSWIEGTTERDRPLPHAFTNFQIYFDFRNQERLADDPAFRTEYSCFWLKSQIGETTMEIAPGVEIEVSFDYKQVSGNGITASTSVDAIASEIQVWESSSNFIRYQLELEAWNTDDSLASDRYFWVKGGSEVELNFAAFSREEIIVPHIRTFLGSDPYYTTLKGNKLYNVTYNEDSESSVKTKETNFEIATYSLTNEGEIIKGKVEKYPARSLKTVSDAFVWSVLFYPP